MHHLSPINTLIIVGQVHGNKELYLSHTRCLVILLLLSFTSCDLSVIKSGR